MILVLLYMLSGILIATILRGFGGPAPEDFLLNTIKICAAQLFLILALNCVGTFLIFTTKRTAIVNTVYIAFCILPGIIILALSLINPDVMKIIDYSLIDNIGKFALMDELETADFVKAFGSGIIYIVATTTVGIVLFRRAEIK